MTTADYFERLYAESGDPWNLSDRAYERRKYELTVASLPRQTYASGFEPACSIGVLTGLLADRCDQLLATDSVAAPLRRAEASVGAPHLTFRQAALPDQWPSGTFDLIVLSEVLYYLSATSRARVLQHVLASLRPDGHLVLVHWRWPFEAADCTGDEAHAEFRASNDLVPLVEHLEEDFRLEVYGRG